MAVITIAREMGSLGDELGEDLAKALGYELLNKEIVRRVATKTGSLPEDVEQYDERADSAVVRFLTRVFAAHPEMAAYYSTFAHVEPTYAYGVTEPYVFYEAPAGTTKPVDPGKVVKQFEEIIREMAAGGNVVIIGRGSQVILKGQPNTYHLRTVAPVEWRLANVMKRNPDLSRQDTEELINRNDRWRERYLSVNYGARWADPMLYHMVVPMDKWEMGRLVEVLKGLAAN
jgi:cytidylate kinase